ncbi:MAG: hypothetical protein JSW15_12185 [Deltaproteobacteria bacterium]|nr:MAG: hypothetical protein JSW15_12185 [Deltaproteobacteria bacterium]
MELAFHLRDPGQVEKLNEFPRHLLDFYDGVSLREKDWIEGIPQSLDRIYIGDEFCFNRLPSLGELDRLYQFAEKKGLGVTFLTPPLTDEGLERSTPLLDYLKERDPRTEVVVNDWGVLSFLNERYPLFQLAIGRLLNKGFKDPRLLDANEASLFSEETEELLNNSTFDSVDFQEKMLELKVTRLERDLLPYGEHKIESHPQLETSIYFPFGYITTGRVCWIASFKQSAKEKFAPLMRCARFCNALTLKLNSDKFSFQLFQGGNTVFYLYTPSMLDSLIKGAKRKNFRLVYQGLAIGVS